MFAKLRRFLISGTINPSQTEQRAAHVSWEEIGGKQCMIITFNGIFTENDAVKLTDYMEKQLAALPEGHIVPLVCRCYSMTDYEAHARIVFQSFLQAQAHRIETLWIVTRSQAIKYGGKLLSAFSPIPVKIVETEDKIL